MMVSLRRSWPWAFALMLVSASSRAEEPGLERKYRTALELRARGEDATALVILRDIDAKAPTGRSLAQVALAEQAVGDWGRAEEDLQAAVRRGGDWVSQNRPALDAALATIQKRLGSLELVCDGCSERLVARAIVDGIDVGPLPLAPLRLELGVHRLEVHSVGYFDVIRDVEIAPGKLVREHVRLVATPAPASAPGAATVEPRNPIAPPREPVSSSPREARSSAATVLGWSVIGAGAVSLGASVVLALASNGAAHDYNDDPSCGASPKPSRCAALREDVDDNRTFAIVTGLAGAALVGTGIAIFVGTAPSRTNVVLAPYRASVTFRF